jgi:predicted lipid-binding transport protein (Tim44 family)
LASLLQHEHCNVKKGQIYCGGLAVNKFLLRLLLAAAVTVLAVSLTQSGEAQSPSQGTAKAAQSDPAQSAPAAEQQNNNNEVQMPASGDTTTHEANAFTGRVVKQDGEIVLMDAITKVTYKFDDPAKAKKYLGQQVKVTGKLEMNSNTILVESIEIIS